MPNIYDNVVEVAKKKGIPLYKLEKEAGLAQGAISKWKTMNPRVDSLVSVAQVLSVSVGKLLKEK